MAVIGDLKQMNADWLKGTSMVGYGVTMTIGIGVPIPIINEEMAYYTSVRDEQIFTQIVDYSKAYPEGTGEVIGRIDYAALRSGKAKILDKEVPTGGLSSYAKAREIAHILKQWIKEKRFFLTEPVAYFPPADSGYKTKSLEIR